MKNIYILFLSLLISTLSAQGQTASITTWKNDAKAAYSIVHDDYGLDGADGIWKYADTIAYNRGIKFVFGAYTQLCESRSIKPNGYANLYTYAKEVMMAKHGHEIANHSYSHACAAERGWSPCKFGDGESGWGESPLGADLDQEINQAHKSILNGTGFAPQYYVYPYDVFTNATNKRLEELGYLGSRTGWSSPSSEDVNAGYHRNGYENSDLSDFYPNSTGFFRNGVEVFDDNKDAKLGWEDQLIELNQEIDKIIKTNMYANREFHNVGNSGWGHVKEKAYRGHMDYLKAKVDAGDLWVGTASEIFTYQMQKLKYEAVISQTAETAWEVSWNSINPQYDVDLEAYLKDLSYTSPLTLKADFSGRTGDWKITQNGEDLNYVVKNKIFYIDVFPHKGKIDLILNNETTPAPEVVSPIEDFKLPAEFITFTIDLNEVFEDANTRDENLVYSISGNTNINIEINNGIATISSTFAWEGTENITFSAKDESNQTTGEEVKFVVNGRNEPYTGTPIEIPGKIEAENFDLGGLGVSYHEKDTSKNTTYRDDNVEINKIGDGYNITMIDGEWLEYTINVAKKGVYDFDIAANSNEKETAVKLFLNGKDYKTFDFNEDGEIYKPSKIYNLSLDTGKFVLRVTAVGSIEIDSLTISTPGENTLPKVVAPLEDQKLVPNFVDYSIDLSEVFEDLETNDADLIYSASGNQNIIITINENIALISHTDDWEGIEDITFTAKDFSEGTTDHKVKFEVSQAFARPNESVNNDEGYIFTFDQKQELNCVGSMISEQQGNRKGYKIESVGGGNMIISSNGEQFGGDAISLTLNNECKPAVINLSHPNKQIMEIKIKSTVDVPEFMALLGDVNGIYADAGVSRPSLKAGEWQTLTFEYSNMSVFGNTKNMDPAQLTKLSLYFRNDFENVPQKIAGTFTIDYIKIGGELVPCPAPTYSYNGFINREKKFGFDTGKDAVLGLTTTGSDLSFQWYKDDETLSTSDLYQGTDTDNLIIKDFQESDLGNYYCEIKEACGKTVKTNTRELIFGDKNKPYKGVPLSIPGRVEGEHYDLGGEGVAHHDANTSKDFGNVLREEGVDVMSTPFGYSLTSVWNAEWVEYTINVKKDGYYHIDVRASAWNDVERYVQLSLDGDSLSYIRIINSLNLDIYTTSRGEKVWMTAGEHVLRANFYRSIRLDYIDFIDASIPTAKKIKNINVNQGFNEITMNLKDTFDDLETSDDKLAFTVKGNDKLQVEIKDGIATITANKNYTGSETLVFTAKDETDQTVDADVKITVNPTQGIHDGLTNYTLSVFPNPVHSELHIKSNHMDEEIQLFDIIGQKLGSYNYISTIDVSELLPGTYILKQGNAQIRFIKR